MKRKVSIVFITGLILVLGIKATFTKRCDFNTSYRFGKLVVEGSDIYGNTARDGLSAHQLYPPFYAVLMVPFTFLERTRAKFAWFVLDMVCLVLAVRLSARLILGKDHSSPPKYFYLLPVVMTARFFINNLVHGQVNIMLFFMVIASLCLYSEGKDVLSGILLGLAASVKLTPLLFIVYSLYKGRFKVFIGSVIALAVFFVLPGFVFSFPRYFIYVGEWYSQVMSVTFTGRVSTIIFNQSMPAAIYRLFSSVDLNTARYFVLLLELVLLALILCFSRAKTGRKDGRLCLEYSLVFIGCLLMPPVSNKASFVSLFFPYMAIVHHFLKTVPGDAVLKWLLAGSFLLNTLTAEFLGSRLSDFFEGNSCITAGTLLLLCAILRALSVKSVSPVEPE